MWVMFLVRGRRHHDVASRMSISCISWPLLEAVMNQPRQKVDMKPHTSGKHPLCSNVCSKRSWRGGVGDRNTIINNIQSRNPSWQETTVHCNNYEDSPWMNSELCVAKVKWRAWCVNESQEKRSSKTDWRHWIEGDFWWWQTFFSIICRWQNASKRQESNCNHMQLFPITCLMFASHILWNKWEDLERQS